MVALHKDDIMKKLGFALAALLLANSGYAQTPMPSAEKSFTPSTQEELVLDTSSKRAHVEVWFSGGQKERFVFEEGTLSVIEKTVSLCAKWARPISRWVHASCTWW